MTLITGFLFQLLVRVRAYNGSPKKHGSWKILARSRSLESVFALLYFVLEGNFPGTRPRGAYICRGDLTEGFFALPVWGAYIWRGLFSEFYGTGYTSLLKETYLQ